MTAKAKRQAKKLQKPLPPPIGRAIQDSDVLELLRRSWPTGMSRREICDALGRQVTPTLIQRIEKFVDSGHFTRDIDHWPNGVRGYKYTYVMSKDEMTMGSEWVLDQVFDKDRFKS